ncbi:MAG: SRPBCC domain-containing protein [Alphaproteobacteria bacterium]|nr:SRPBCC domain-containing protein [Alphaproteobacteria bacterium]
MTISAQIAIEVRINAAPGVIFPFLTCPARMRIWLAPVVEFAARVGGRFVMADLNGLRIEGEVAELVPDSTLTLTWGGIEGLTAGQSVVRFTLAAAAEDSIVHLCHRGLPDPACAVHGFAWRFAGLPRLKRVIEGGAPGGTYLGDIADARERAHCWTVSR